MDPINNPIVSELLSRIANLESAIKDLRDPELPEGNWFGADGFTVEGTKSLYKVVALREYDENGALIAVGSESTYNGGSLAAGHTLKPTWDWERLHQ